jgi:rhodanese-related sulfurtransferase
MPKITLSYRRKDSDAITGRIRDRMVEHFGQKAVFMDIDSIPLGIDFRKQIQEVLRENQVLLAVIGPNWTGPVANGPARIFDPSDPVRIEVETALRSGIPTIPVLVGGATMPSPAELPDSLKELPFYNAAEVSSGLDFHAHVDRLIRAVEQITKTKGSSARRIGLSASKWFIAGGAIVCLVLLGFGVTYFLGNRAKQPSATAASQTAPATPPVAAAQPTPQPATSAQPTSQPPQSVPIEPAVGKTPAKDTAEAKAAASACDPGSAPAFYDNFKVIDPDWYALGTNPHAPFYLADGQLVMAPPADTDAATSHPAIFKNTSICVGIVSPPAMIDPSATGAGIVFWSSDTEHYTDAIIIPNGGYRIEKWLKDSSTPLAQGKTDAVKTGPRAVNEIKITNSNDSNALYINNHKVKEFKGQVGKGQDYIGLYAVSEANQTDEWRFSYIVMTQPNYGNEFTDFRVPPQTVLQHDVGTYTPTTIPGAKVITTSDLNAAMQLGSLDGSAFLLVDVLDDTHPKTMRGAKRIPNRNGYAGNFDDDAQQSLRAQLTTLTKNNLNMPIVFFCKGVQCWESYNAALRAEKMGFARVYWYRGGLAAWTEAELPTN